MHSMMNSHQDNVRPRNWRSGTTLLITMGLISGLISGCSTPDRVVAFDESTFSNPEAAKKVYAKYHQELEGASATERYRSLGKCASAAAFANENARARELAHELLQTAQNNPKDWYTSNAIHQAWIVLGHVALNEKNIGEAESALIKSAEVDGSPQLSSFGPNMMLAKLLLQNDREQSVLRYLQLCKLFWHSNKIKCCVATINSGGIPRFGKNLYYYWYPTG